MIAGPGVLGDNQRGRCPGRVAAAVKGRSTDPEAHRLFLQARYFIDRNTGEDTKRGIGYLKQALALEPEKWARLFASAVIHHAAGRRAESDAALRELAER